jgi:hypothetical protein
MGIGRKKILSPGRVEVCAADMPKSLTDLERWIASALAEQVDLREKEEIPPSKKLFPTGAWPG